MSTASSPDNPWVRRLVFAILIAGAALQVYRISQVRSTGGEVPFHSANDRSRWCTIASLAINGKYEIDDIIELRDPKTRKRTWYSIDMVRHRGADGNLHYYSSKPPLLPTMYTGVYLAVRSLTGASLMKQTFFVARTMLILVNLLPLVALWWVMARWTMRELPGKPWATIVSILFLVFGTFLSTFSNTLNNHLPAAIACGLSLWCLDAILCRKQTSWVWFVGCGLATSFTAANEMPALSWVAIVSGLLMIFDWRRAIGIYLPAMLPIAIAFFVTNYLAHGVWRPAYAHRDLGARIFEYPVQPNQAPDQTELIGLLDACRAHNMEVSDSTVIRPGRRPGVFELWDETNQRRWGIKSDGTQSLGIYQWDDWYDYPGSYWIEGKKQGVDKGEPSMLRYAFHCLIGHHGVFSLTPIWLLCIWGGIDHMRRVFGQPKRNDIIQNENENERSGSDLTTSESSAIDWPMTWLHLAIAITSVTCIAFYLTRPLEDRNYGGVTSGLRWLFWLTPLWYWMLIQALKSSRIPTTSVIFRRLVEIGLAVSIFSATYPFSNPWISPWPFR